jgi:hypothetical protein
MLIRYVNKYCVVIGKFMPFSIKTNYVLVETNHMCRDGWRVVVRGLASKLPCKVSQGL